MSALTLSEVQANRVPPAEQLAEFGLVKLAHFLRPVRLSVATFVSPPRRGVNHANVQR